MEKKSREEAGDNMKPKMGRESMMTIPSLASLSLSYFSD